MIETKRDGSARTGVARNDRFTVVLTGSYYRESDRVAAALADIAEVVIAEAASREELVRLLLPADALLTDIAPVDEELLAQLPKLKAVLVMGVGTDNIDLAAAKRHRVAVSNSPAAYSTPVAEHAIALLLTLMRNVAVANDDIKRMQVWETYGDRYRAVEVRGKTLGLMGFGRIGRETARIASGIGMRTIAYDPLFQPGSAAASAHPLIGFKTSVDELLSESHAVSLHLPLGPSTRNLMDRRRLALMRPGSYLVNVSRGALIDQAALREALASGRLAGAGLDVFAPEPPEWGDSLLRERNLVLTPHIGWLSESAPLRCQLDAADEVRRLLMGEPPKHPVA